MIRSGFDEKESAMQYLAKLTALALGLSWAAGASAATSPTPTLKTGDYAGQRAIFSSRDPTSYSSGVAVGKHPTTIHYDAASQTYVFSDGPEGYYPRYSFSPNEIVTTQSTAAYTVYRDRNSGAGTLKLLNQSPTNPVIALTYVTYGKWTQPPTPDVKVADNYMVFGQITPPASVPRSGSASYKAILDGTYQQASSIYRLSGNAVFAANFGTGTMGLTVTPVATSLSNGSTLSFGTLTGSGFIYFDSSSFNATSRTRSADGVKTLFSAQGNFFGPQANEIGGVFTLTKTLGSTFGSGAGAFVGKKN
jgi:C-lobe and N-lobe beta barrels of Tf-binding protein B